MPRRLLGATVTLGALPLALYAGARLFGLCPDPAEWAHQASNHGPWWDTLPGLIIYLSDIALMALAIVTLARSSLALTMRRNNLLPSGLALVALQIALIVGHFRLLFWTVD